MNWQTVMPVQCQRDLGGVLGTRLRLAGAAILQRNVADLPLQFPLESAVYHQQEILNADAQRGLLANCDHARHPQATPNALVSVVRHRGDVMGEDNPVLVRGPSEKLRVVSGQEADILGADNVKRRTGTAQASYDNRTEVLIGEESKHL